MNTRSDIKLQDSLGVFGAAIQGGRSEQDAFRLRKLEENNSWLLVLADGMGGHVGGGLASRIAVDGFVAAFSALQNQGSSIESALRGATEDANARISQAQKNSPEVSDMGTTLVAAHVSPRGLTWISVGDSPMWLFRPPSLYRLNEDHSLREFAPGSKGNMLRSVLNGQPIPMIDCQAEPVPLATADVLLLASDGLLTLDEGSISNIVAARGRWDSKQLGEFLLHEVMEQKKPNQDNCTVIAATVLANSVAVPAASKPIAPKSKEQSSKSKLSRSDLAIVAASALAGFATVAVGYLFLLAR